jgi:hypothetical protein
MRKLLHLVADFMIGWHQDARERHYRAEQKWRARFTATGHPPIDYTIHFESKNK